MVSTACSGVSPPLGTSSSAVRVYGLNLDQLLLGGVAASSAAHEGADPATRKVFFRWPPPYVLVLPSSHHPSASSMDSQRDSPPNHFALTHTARAATLNPLRDGPKLRARHLPFTPTDPMPRTLPAEESRNRKLANDAKGLDPSLPYKEPRDNNYIAAARHELVLLFRRTQGGP